MIAMFYLRPYLIRERDERERQKLSKKIKEDNEAVAGKEDIR
jgi:hypothetical protein